MKQFDLEKAKAGAPVIARNGMAVKFLGHYPDAAENCRVAFMTPADASLPWLNRCQIWTCNERGQQEVGENDWDLFMAPVKREGWVNVYLDHLAGHYVVAQGRIWDCKESACAVASSIDAKVATVQIEWEEE